jgi:spermidine synthase
MNRSFLTWAICLAVLCLSGLSVQAGLVFRAYSAYHHILVVDDGGIRTLKFNNSMETRMSLANPLQGHFEYTEYFHMPWLWNTNIERVLMIGLGGGSTQRSFQHYYTNVVVDTVELDPVVVTVAKKYFGVVETPQHKIHQQDGRVFLRRTTNQYGVIVMDAYTTTRYGSSIPAHLTTKEFFELAAQRLTTNGVLAYNIIGQLNGQRADIVGSLYQTLKDVFGQVYLFPATSSQNIVLIATKADERYDAARARREGTALIQNGTIKLPTFALRLASFMNLVPPTASRSPVLTDDRSGVEGLLR